MTDKSAPQNAQMDEILSSIRDIVKEETDRAPAEKPAPAAAQSPADDVLELTEAEVVSAPDDAAAATEDLVDIKTFAETGETQAPQAADVQKARSAYTDADTAEAAPAAAQNTPSAEDLMAEMAAGAADSDDTETQVVAEKAAPAATPAPQPKAQAPKTVALNAIPAASGLQVGFPVEVLAEALRPLVKNWVEANLPEIVEKLVREELSRLVENND